MRFHRSTIRLILTAAGGLMLALVPARAAAQAGGSNPKTVLDGVYTMDQSNRGAAAFETYCYHCHIEDPEMPALTGRNFIDRWREDSLGVLYAHIRDRMPADGRRLDETTYENLLAFMLHDNNYPPGRQPLDADTVDDIRLIGHDGPQPLPNNSIVRLVGCIASEGDEWVLTRATDPARTKDGRETSDDERARSRRASLGSRTYPLYNFMNIRLDFDPAPMAGHRVQAKGVLIRRSQGERISLIALETLSETCEP